MRAHEDTVGPPPDLAALAPEVERLTREVGRALATMFHALHGGTGDGRLAGKTAQADVQIGALAEGWAFAKTDGSPVTQADLLADRLLQAGLAALTPQIAIVSEESVDPVAHTPTPSPSPSGQDAPVAPGLSPELPPGPAGAGSDVPPRAPSGSSPDRSPARATAPSRFWLVDPLDGTKAFLAGSPNFCICVALVEDGRPVFGLIHAPVSATSWWAWRGAGRVRRRVGGRDEEVLRQRAPADPRRLFPRVAVSEHHRGSQTQAWLDRHPGAEIVAMSSALKFCALIEGRVDVYLRTGETMAWDIAAGQCLVEVAGGQVRALATGAPLRYSWTALRNPDFVADFPGRGRRVGLPA